MSKEFSVRIRTRVYSDTIKNQFIISGVEILIKILEVNLPKLEEFFELNKTNLVKDTIDYLIQNIQAYKILLL